jgi:hypothetical protein
MCQMPWTTPDIRVLQTTIGTTKMLSLQKKSPSKLLRLLKSSKNLEMTRINKTTKEDT